MPQISVIVPVYNVEPYLRRCVDSILAQTFTDFELILVDDGSPDNCGEICDEYAARDERVVVIHKKNGGLSDARNAGIDWAFANSDSECITFIDSDDWVYCDYLNYLFKAVKDNCLELSICTYDETDTLYPVSTEFYDYSNQIVETESFFCNNRINAVIACGKLYSKTSFEDIRFPVGKLHEDEFTTYKLLFKHKEVAFVDLPLYHYYINTSSITKSKWNLKRLDAIDALEQQLCFFKSNSFEKAYFFTLRVQILNCSKSIIKIEKFFPSEKKIIRSLRRTIKKNTKYTFPNLLSDEESKLVYKTSHPILFKIKIYTSRKFRHIKELIRGE